MRAARGFTLIELLVVLVILGTLVSLALLSVGNGGGRVLRDEGERLATVMALLVGLFEPFMLVFMGAVVLVIVLAILLPILSLNQLVG